MPITVTVSKDPKNPRPYPKLMVNAGGYIAYWGGPNQRPVNIDHPSYKFGDLMLSANQECWEDFSGKITLENS